jgi:Fic family protein
MPLTPHMEPMIPSSRRDLEELALEVFKASAKLAGRVHPVTAKRLIELLRSVNSYYSNLIEGVRTTLLDIENSLRVLSDDERTRRQQLLHAQNIKAQRQLEEECPGDSSTLTSSEFLCRLHELLFAGVPEEFLVQRNERGDRQAVMTPGTLRDEEVRVGSHVPPSPASLPHLLLRFQEAYSLPAMSGTTRLVCAAASHHRLLWIHPFLEGNGRVARLFTDVYLFCSGLDGYGLWTISRGLARRNGEYKALLSGADAMRQGDFNGRGALSEKGLHRFCAFFLETALDQAGFMNDLLGLDTAVKNIELYCTLRTLGRLAGKSPLPKESPRILAHTFLHGRLPKGEVHKLIGVSDRTARDVVKVLLKEGLLETENQKAPLTMGFPPETVQFIFPDLCDSGAFAEERLARTS